LRPSATIKDVVAIARKWIVVPGCKVRAEVDSRAPIDVGFTSVKAALEAYVARHRTDLNWDAFAANDDEDSTKPSIRVVQRDANGVSLAYALRWSDYFKEWQFVMRQMTADTGDVDLGTCVEGVRVTSGSPGFGLDSRSGLFLVSMANVVGRNAPKTNVARSSFEKTDENKRMLGQIYFLYAAHVAEEFEKLHTERDQSITWATSEVPYLANAVSSMEIADSSDQLLAALQSIPMILLEENGTRYAISSNELARRDFFWTIDGALPRHIEYLLREIPESISLTTLLRGLGSTGVNLPEGPLICTQLEWGIYRLLIERDWTIQKIHADEARRRCDAKWIKVGSGALWSDRGPNGLGLRWRDLAMEYVDLAMRNRYSSTSTSYSSYLDRGLVGIPIRGVDASGFDSKHSAVYTAGSTYLLPGSKWVDVIRNDKTGSKEVKLEDRSPSDPALEALSILLLINKIPLKQAEDTIRELRHPEIKELLDLSLFMELRNELGWNVYDTRRWERG
jgi:hypothetical protein